MVQKQRTKRRRHMRGGEWYNPMTWTQTSTSEYGPKKSWSDYTTDFTKSVSNGFNSVFSTTPSPSSYTSSASPTSSSSSSYSSTTTMPSATTATPSTTTATSPYQAPPNDVRYQQMTGTSSSSTTGGKKHRRKGTLKKRRGGGGSQDLNYATPVFGIKTAEPTYWIKYNPSGGKKRRTRRRSMK